MSHTGCHHPLCETDFNPIQAQDHTHPTTMKLVTVIPDVKKIKTHMNHVRQPLGFSPEISRFCYIKKYRSRLHFGT